MSRQKQLYPALLVVYGVSGMTALAYEVLWVRMLGLQFGVSIFGVVITVSAFMAGLGIGSLAAVKWLWRIRAPLKWFAGFELCIAIMALGTPWLLLLSEGLLASVAAHSTLVAWYIVQFALAGFLLFVPAFCMGAGFPVILKAFGDFPQSLAKAYGVNTLGASIGALLPLTLLPTVGWLTSMQTIAALGILVSMFAFYLSIHSARDTNHNESKVQVGPTSYSTPNLLPLIAYAGIGAAALILEVAWTRLFGMIMLRTEYVLAIILAAYLVGVGLGSVLTRFLRGDTWYAVLPVIACGYVIAGLWLLPQVAMWLDNSTGNSLVQVIALQAAALVLLTLPVTLVLGAWLPTLNKLLGNNHISGAWLYGSNSIGAAVGALLAGFVLTPLVGSSATVVIAALMLLIFGFTWSRNRYVWIAVPLAILAAYPVIDMPTPAQLSPSLYHGSRQLYSYEDAVSITQVVEQPNGERLLLTDLQRMDAASDPASVAVQKNQTRLPLLLHPHPKSVLLLGLGTGISAAGSLAYPQLQRTSVELSQGAVEAAQKWFSPVNDNVTSHMSIVRDDARRFLMAGGPQYDVIIGDLFHPDLVGRSALLSVQQFARAKQRLSAGGIFVQWLALNQFTVDAFETVVRSFQQQFPHAVVFVDAFRVALVGRKEPQQGHNLPGYSLTALDNLSRLSEAQQQTATGGEGVWTWLGRYWGPLSVGEGAMQDEWAPRIEFALPQARYSGKLDLAKILNYLSQRRPTAAQAAVQLQVPQNYLSQFENAYDATGLAHKSWLAFLTSQSASQNFKAEKMLQTAYQSNPKDRWIGFAVADGALASLDSATGKQYDETQVLESVLKVRPDHPEALLRLWRLWKARGNPQKAAEFKARLAKIDPFSKALKQPD